MFNKYHVRRLLWGLLLTGSMAIAGGPQYMGFTLNLNSKEDVIQTLKARHAVFNTDYGYKGYAKDLPVIKVITDPLFASQGEVEDAWLEFTPDQKLYRIAVQWRDPGKTYTTIKDVFDEKYQHQENSGRGFVVNHIYKNGDTKITLSRNAFGFGSDQKTRVEYLYLPALPKVEKMKQEIDRHIKNKTIKEKGVNL